MSTTPTADFEDAQKQAAALAAKQRLKSDTSKLLLSKGPIEAAKFLAQALFKDIKYGNRPYIEHLTHVAEAQLKGPQPYGHRVAAGYLHDLLEDIKGWTVKDLQEIGFSKMTTDIVVAVTKQKGESYFNAMQRISYNGEAIHVKLADLGMNSNAGGLPHAPNEKDLARMQKYWMAQRYLEAVRDKKLTAGSCPSKFLTENIDKFARDENHKQQLLKIIDDNYTFPNTSPPPQQELKVA